jgi:hypothetical protein
MKHCPACNFSFPDFHRVCDFDGTELVADPERPLPNSSPHGSRFRRALKSPVPWAGLLLIGVVSSAFLVAYYDAVNQSTPVVKDQPSPSSSVAQASEQSPALIKTPVPSKHAGSRSLNTLPGESAAILRRQRTSPPTLARLHQRTSNRTGSVSEPRAVATGSQKSQIARRKNSEEISDRKEPKLTAMLKTTWRVLKKPFKF